MDEGRLEQLQRPISPKELIAKSIEGQEPSWKNVLSRKFVGIEDVVKDLERRGELEQPPHWFGRFAKQAIGLWFDPKSFESEKTYERLGIKAFKKYLPTGDDALKLLWKSSKENPFIRGSSETDLRQYEKFTRIYEGMHTAFLPMAAANIGMSLANGDLERATFVAGINILVNVYPIMLQRYNRLRLYKVISKAQERKQKGQ